MSYRFDFEKNGTRQTDTVNKPTYPEALTALKQVHGKRIRVISSKNLVVAKEPQQ